MKDTQRDIPKEVCKADAQYLIGNGDLYLNGWGVKQDIEKAVYHYQIASNDGNELSTKALAEIFENSLYSRKDYVPEP